ncbi:hypothetical protein VB713_11770 [Anabaena cylindrica UHCC 0172]|nr:hypothetical protein [Anabaena cylindrica]MEA5551649.1 hypothetical protein [Anabaena cylindrica UHCC 0172]
MSLRVQRIVPEPSSMLSSGMFVLAGSILKPHTKRKNALIV